MYNYGILDHEKCYKHPPEQIIETKVASILLDFAIQTDRRKKQ